jgi:flagellar hook-associated protein 2
MSSPITFSGFNNIDFGSIITAQVNADSQPMTDMQTKEAGVKGEVSTISSLTTQLQTLDTAVTALADPTQFSAFGAAVSDSTAASVTTTGSAVPGHYDVVVKELARSQVTASASTAPDANTTAVATGGSITINGVTVSVSGNTTLQGLANAINAKSGTNVNASVVQSASNAYRLVLTGLTTGTAGAFTVTNNLTGGSGIAFTDTNGDGISGNSAADNAQQATDADIVVNGVESVGSSNTFDSVIPGSTLTVTKKDPSTTVGVDITTNSDAMTTQVNAFITAYNSLVSFFNGQKTAAANGDLTSIGNEPFMRSLQQQLRSIMIAPYGSGSYNRLSTMGIEATQTGTLQLNQTVFNDAIANNTANMKTLFTGTGGAYATMQAALDSSMSSTGVLATATNSMNASVQNMDAEIAAMQARLAIEKTTLTAMYTAADTTMSDLQSQGASLSGYSSSLGSGLTSSGG